MKHNFSIWLLLSCLLFVGACGDQKSTSKPTSSAPAKRVKIPSFNSDSAYHFIEKQLDFGYRVPGTAAHKECGEWLKQKLDNYGAEVIQQDFEADFLDVQGAEAFNIIGQFNKNHSKRILLAAHWDSRLIAEKDSTRQDEPIAGADDGASGVAVLLEIARLISANEIDMGIDIIFFDAEDQGQNDDQQGGKTWCLGSQYWSKNLIPTNYQPRYGILLDMVGSEGASFGREGFSYKYVRSTQDKIWQLAKRMGYSDFFVDIQRDAVTDDHIFVMQGTRGKIKMLNIINQTGGAGNNHFGHYHHTHKDDIDIISKRTLKVVGQVVTAALYNESIGKL